MDQDKLRAARHEAAAFVDMFGDQAILSGHPKGYDIGLAAKAMAPLVRRAGLETTMLGLINAYSGIAMNVADRCGPEGRQIADNMAHNIGKVAELLNRSLQALNSNGPMPTEALVIEVRHPGAA